MPRTREQLARDWALIYAQHKEEIKSTYDETVAKGNKQTYSEFVEETRRDWIEEMLKK